MYKYRLIRGVLMLSFEIPEKYKLISDDELVILYKNGVQDAFSAL